MCTLSNVASNIDSNILLGRGSNTSLGTATLCPCNIEKFLILLTQSILSLLNTVLWCLVYYNKLTRDVHIIMGKNVLAKSS